LAVTVVDQKRWAASRLTFSRAHGLDSKPVDAWEGAFLDGCLFSGRA
jgi:predicted oxidoreductase